jgi:hypothetical protein
MIILDGELLNCNNSDFAEISCKVVITIRLHAMYLGSRKILIFLVVIFLALAITAGVLLVKVRRYARSGKF